MWRSILALDRVLRGESTQPQALRDARIEIPTAGLFVVIVALGMVYGAFMRTLALVREGDPSYWQWLASTVKVPALFVLTLIVTFPSLYVFNALVGSRLS